MRPSLAALPDYVAALARGWSPDNLRGAVAAREQLEKIEADAAGFVAGLDNPPAAGMIMLADGSMAPRLPGFIRWIWDGAFCGSIGLRWQKGTAALPAYVPGHIGFAVVPWKRGAGHARRALALMLREAAAQGLAHVELTTDPENDASQKVILACGGVLLERFQKIAALGGGESLRFRIEI
jgi:predicted acetyltransferase